MYGITEAGDASMDYSWEQKLDTVTGATLITKFPSDKFLVRVLPYSNKPVMLHITITGYGGTAVEPHVCKPTYALQQIRKLIDMGWDPKRIVLRIDPIIPTQAGIWRFATVVWLSREIIPEVTRVRVSILDMYHHVRKRFEKAGLPDPYNGNFQCSGEQARQVNVEISKLKKQFPELQFESCAEKMLFAAETVGCVSKKDFDTLGVEEKNDNVGYQRPGCHCSSAKKELLEHKKDATGFNHCYGCLYCYWQTDADKKGDRV